MGVSGRDDDSSSGEQSADGWVTRTGSLPWWCDLIGLAIVVAAGFAVMIPALTHGSSLGPFGLLAHDGVLKQRRAGTHNPFAADQVTQLIPWTWLAWEQVHHGLLPLWNPYNALGAPLAFNWQSATFSLPALLGYLAPLRFSYTVQVLGTLVIAGTGAYVLARVVRLTLVACVFAGVAFELSGSFIGWLGWPVSSVMSWSGWMFAAALLVLSGRRRVRSIVLFSVVVALAIYAGQPDTLVLLGFLLVVFVLVVLVMESGQGLQRRARAFGDLVVAGIAGCALGAPLLLPGTQLLSASSRNVGGGVFSGQQSLSMEYLMHLWIPGLDGQPVGWHRTYLGVVAVALAVIGLVASRRRPQVVAMGAVAIVAGIICFTPFVESALNSLPGVGAVRWARSINFLEFGIAMLGGVGLDLIIRSSNKRVVLQLSALVFSVTALVVVLIDITHSKGDRIRHQNLQWAAGGAILGLVVVGVLEIVRRRGSGQGDTTAESRRHRRRVRSAGLWALGGGVLLLAYQGTFLGVNAASQWSATSRPFHPTAAEEQLSKAVGSSLVGYGSTACERPPELGIPAEANIVYGVHELAAYDPALPRKLYTSWTAATGKPAGYPPSSRYCPAVTSAAIARTYGVSFVLTFRGRPGPKGSIFVKKIGTEDLYRIPGAAQATVVPLSASGQLPPDDAEGTPVVSTSPQPTSWNVVVDAQRPAVLRLRLTDVPGWHASIDGHPLPLEPFAGAMLQARIPPGHHVVVVEYWPATFTDGIVLAVLSAVGLIVASVIGVVRRRRRPSEGGQASV
jgi:hypothetical protein